MSIKQKIHVIHSEEGDWEAIYINGRLKSAKHMHSMRDVLVILGVIDFTSETRGEEFWDVHGHGPELLSDIEGKV